MRQVPHRTWLDADEAALAGTGLLAADGGVAYAERDSDAHQGESKGGHLGSRRGTMQRGPAARVNCEMIVRIGWRRKEIGSYIRFG